MTNIPEECLPCKILAYSTTFAATIYGLASFKKNRWPALIVGSLGGIGLSTFIYRDLNDKKI